MKFALIHISGEHRGQTQYFDCSRVSLGSDPSNDLIFSTVGPQPLVPLHVELYEADCEIHLHNQDPSVTTLVNHNPLGEATLHDRDLIQLGPEGPKLRFRIQPEEYTACKRSREILRDAWDVSVEARNAGRGVVRSFFAQLVYDLRRHATRSVQLLVVALLILLLGGIGGGIYYSYLAQQAYEEDKAALLKQLESARLSQAELEQRTEGERVKMGEALTAHQVEIDQMVAMLEEQNRQGRRVSPEEVQLIQSRLKALEVERRSAQVLIRRYGSSICFLYGAYGFLQKGQSAGVPHSLLEYMGTGFLIDKKGLIVTNQHLVEPWTMDPSGAEIVKDGFQPTLVTLLAYFPGRPQPSEVLLVQVSKEGDVALGRVVPIPQGITPIPLRTQAAKGVVGEAVVVLGYPVGVEGVLARMKEQIVDALLKKPDRSLRRLVHDIAEQRGIRPLATQGHIGDIVPGRLVYDAQTMGGSSGSPVFNLAGEVIAVNSAYLEPFRGGASFGVPIAQVLSLIPERS